MSQHRYAAAIFYADKLCSLVLPVGLHGRRASVSPAVSALPPLSRVLPAVSLLPCQRRVSPCHSRTAHSYCRVSAHTAANTSHDMDDVWHYIQSADEAHDDEIADNDDDAADDESSKENQHADMNASMTETDKPGRRQPTAMSAASAVTARARLVLECWLLLSTCLFRCRDYEESLLVLGADDTSAQHQLHRLSDTLHTDPTAASLLASAASHRGDIYSQQQNRTKACHWYLHALRYDVQAVDAFDRLVERSYAVVRSGAGYVERARLRGVRVVAVGVLE